MDVVKPGLPSAAFALTLTFAFALAVVDCDGGN